MSKLNVVCCKCNMPEYFMHHVGIRRTGTGLLHLHYGFGRIPRVLRVQFRRSFGTPKCCHPQISDLGFIISWWQLSCEIFLQILTSLELHSNSANRPGILLSHDGSLEVNLLMIFLELSLKKTSRMTKSDIWGWQHLRVPKYLLDRRK